MEISIDHKALQWFKEELRIKHGESIRFNVRYGGDSSIQPGYSLELLQRKQMGKLCQLRKKVFYFCGC